MKTFKRIIASVMVAVMILTAAPLSGFVGLELPDFGALFSMKAEAEEMTEYVDGVFKYSVSNGGAIITGTVYEADFIKTYFGSIEIPSVIGGYPVVEIGHLAFKDFELATALTIPYGVKKIAQGAFYNWKHLRVLELPDSITYIDDMAFGNCSALEILHLPSNLVSLQAGAFKSTGSLKEVVVPKSLIESSFDMCVVGIGMGTVSPFSDSGLTKITFETGRKEIPLGLFNNCNKLTEVYIPDSVEIIGQAAFRDCYSLEKVTGMKNIREICELAFSNCSSLKDVPFLSNLEKLGSGAFYNASSLDEFCVPQSLTDCGIHYSVIGVGMKSRIGPFENSGLIDVSFEEGTDSVPDCIFKGCRRLQTVEIRDNITKIGVASFWECDALLKISGMKNVQEIGDLAFCDCSSLTRIQLPVSLSFLGAGSFAKTISLQTITIPNTLDEVNTYYSYVGIGSGKLYAFDESGLTAVFFQAGLKSIPDYLLSNNSNLKSVNIPKSIKDVGEGAFENCDFLSDVYYYGSEGDWTSVIIDDNNIALSTATIHYLDMEVTEETEYVEGIFTYIIEDGAVTIIGCDKSASGYIAIPSTIRGYKVNKIGANAFSDCYDITSIDMPDSVTTIEEGAFLNCTNMTSIKFSNSLEEIPRRAFFNCGKLKEAYIPDSVKTIGNDAFVYCGSLKVLSLGDNIVNIGMSAFSDCDSLVTVEIGIGLEKVAIGAFYSCDSLSDVYYAGSRVQWENISFRDLNSDLLNATIHYNSTGGGSGGDADDGDYLYHLYAFSSKPQLIMGTSNAIEMTFEIDCYDWENPAYLLPSPTFSFTTSDTNIFSIEKIENRNGRTYVTITGENPGTAFLVVTGYNNGKYVAGGRYMVTVTGETVYHADAIPKFDDYNIIANNIIIDNYKCTNTGTETCNISFDAYNTLNCFGSVELYDSNNNLLESYCIDRFDLGLPTGLWDTVKQAFDISDLKDRTYKNEEYSTKTEIELIAVPRDGHIVISNDPSASTVCAAYNLSYLVADICCEAVSLAMPSGSADEVSDNIAKAIAKETIETLFGNKAMLKKFESFTKDFLTGANCGSRESVDENVKFYSVFLSEIGVDIGDIAIEVFKESLKDLPGDLIETAVYSVFGAAGAIMKTGFKFISFADTADMIETLSENYGAGNTSIYCSKPWNEQLYSNGYMVTNRELFDENVSFHQYKIVDDDTYDKATNTFGDERYIDIIEMSLYKNGVKQQPQGDVEVAMPLPKGISFMDVDVYRMEEDGSYTKIPCRVEDGYIYITTNHFSVYCIVGDKIDIEYMYFQEDYIQVDLNDSVTNELTIYPSDSVEVELVWSSSDESIAVVTPMGNVVGISPGIVEIYASTKDGECYASYTLEVVNSIFVELNMDYISMNYKDSTTITPTIDIDEEVNNTVKYSSSDSSVATVDENGNIVATGTGSATITCTVTDEYGNVVTDTCEVNVSYSWWQWIIVIVLFGWIWY